MKEKIYEHDNNLCISLEDVQINRIKEKYKKLYNKTDVKAKL